MRMSAWKNKKLIVTDDDFNLFELNIAISKSKDTTPGRDRIGYSMLKKT